MEADDKIASIGFDLWADQRDEILEVLGPDVFFEERDAISPPKGQSGMGDPVGLVIAVGLFWLAGRILTWLTEEKKGVVVDLRKTPPLVSRIAAAPVGVLMVIETDGKIRYVEPGKEANFVDSVAGLFRGVPAA